MQFYLQYLVLVSLPAEELRPSELLLAKTCQQMGTRFKGALSKRKFLDSKGVTSYDAYNTIHTVVTPILKLTSI